MRWLSFVNGIAKKGRLELPKFVRFITIMGVFEKLYQMILNNRLTAFIQIPSPQSAYQKGKGYNLHVLAIRLHKILTKKTKQKLFIIFTDFEAAFDLVSRKLLFEKLVKLGISAVMLNALIAIYVTGQSVMEHNRQFSDVMLLLAGVKQGAPPSGILYIAYTMGIIDLFNNKFNIEPLIWMFHLLVHADDIMMLATTRIFAISKLQALLDYCKENFIKLQLTKCAMMCVNSNDPKDYEPLVVDGMTLRSVSNEVYLGSVITDSHKLITDVEGDIKHRQFNIIKFYAFLRRNSNAPLNIKTNILHACIVSSILHNAETWANVNVERLEVSHRRMLRSILGVRTTTCSEFLYVELGVTSIRTQLLLKEWNFWKKVKELDKNEPAKYVVELCRKYKVKEVSHYDKLMDKYQSEDEIISEFKDKIKLCIQRKAAQGRTKYSTYMNINPSLEPPTVYSTAGGHKKVSMIAKLRTSAHNLQIEMGRRTSTPRENRLCRCGEKVEDEGHFLTECRLYTQIRQKHKITTKDAAVVLGDGQYATYIQELYEERSNHN